MLQGERVFVTDATNPYRGCYGTVRVSNAETTTVRFDGQHDNSSIPVPTKSLRLSSQPCPIEYPTVIPLDSP